MMNNKIKISSGVKWEELVGYSRAIRLGNIVEVSGTVAVDGDNIIGGSDAYEQAKFILKKIEKTLHEAGASMEDVIRTRMFVTDISLWNEVGRAHGEFFRDIKPVTTMVEVSSLITPGLLVEIEATAIIS
jgi:enamine deaminase RidA (YjgF/YER057c/UK114 family)